MPGIRFRTEAYQIAFSLRNCSSVNRDDAPWQTALQRWRERDLVARRHLSWRKDSPYALAKVFHEPFAFLVLYKPDFHHPPPPRCCQGLRNRAAAANVCRGSVVRILSATEGRGKSRLRASQDEPLPAKPGRTEV